MNSTVKLKIYHGYKMMEKSRIVSIEDAEKILKSDEQTFYITAIKNGNKAELVSRHIVCPHCREEFAVNTNRQADTNSAGTILKRVTDEKVHEWSSMQISLFENDKNKVLHIGEAIEPPAYFLCPSCKKSSGDSKIERSEEISLKKGRVIIKSEIVDLGEVLSATWIGASDLPVMFPLYEKVIFDIKNGQVYILLESASEEMLTVKEITPSPEDIKSSVFYKLFILNWQVKETVEKMFEKELGSDMPYKGREITAENLFRMTMFVGYKRDFYNAVPYKLRSVAIEPSFSRIAKKLHRAENAIELFEKSQLPKVKTVKRIFFKNPALFFYFEEAQKMWEIVKDVNHYCRFLEMYCVYPFLSDLHIKPGIITFIRDFCRERGVRAFLGNMQKSWSRMSAAATEYKCYNSSQREKMLKSWGKDEKIMGYSNAFSHSIPMKKPNEKIEECSIDGYDFVWLRNSNDYEKAGHDLNNCLVGWSYELAPVMCIKKGDIYVAAIEISDSVIVQARGFKNSTIDENDPFFPAFEKWRENYKLEKISPFDEEDD